MLKLVSTKTTEPISFPLLAGMEYFAGKKNETFAITSVEDPSMRLYARLEVQHSLGNLNEPLLTPTLTVKHPGSTSKVLVGEQKVRLNFQECVTLDIGDKLCFGSATNEFRIDYTPFVAVASSTIPASSELKAQIAALGGHCLDTWSCTANLLVVDEIKLTVKTVCALLAGKWIVSPGYVSELVLAYNIANQSLPNQKNFLPPVAITNRNLKLRKASFYPDSSRTTLFAGKTFLFCNTKHLNDVLLPVTLGGGSAKLIGEAKGENILQGEHIIMGGPHDIEIAMKDPSARLVIEFYKNGNKRFVADEEIGLAALSCSIDKYCNSDATLDD